MANPVDDWRDWGAYYITNDGVFFLRGDGSLERIDKEMADLKNWNGINYWQVDGTPKPKPASESTTIRTSNWITGTTAVLAFLPDALAFLIGLIGDPVVASAVQEFVPLKYRALFGVLIVAISEHYRQLRYRTTQPVAKE